MDMSPKDIVGVPLGGIGTGKIEITPDGMFRHFTINNNYVFPIDEMRGTFLSITCKDRRGTQTKILTSYPQFEAKDSNVFLRQAEISYKGLWPKCILSYTPRDLPIRIDLTAFSPIIPKNLEVNCLPIIYFIFDIENIQEELIDISLNFSWEDINGCWGSKVSWDDWVPATEPHFDDDRGIIRATKLNNALAISFHHKEEHPEVANFAWGDYTLAVRIEGIESYTYQYNPKNIEEVLSLLNREGHLPDRINNNPEEYAGILSSFFRLNPKEKKRVYYVLSWYTPNCWGFGDGSIRNGRLATPYDFAGKKIGHWYANFYNSSLDIIKTHLEKAEIYLEEVENWQKKILDSTLPEWLKEMLINNNYILSATQYWAKDGRYSILESPNCPCIGTLDQRFYGSPTTLIFVPPLEHRELMMYAEYSDKMFEITKENKGQIYHDFGNNRMDSFNNYGYNWIDLNPKFVLLCWRNYLYTGNIDNLRDIYYKMKEAMEREIELDKDGDGLPEGYRNCNTYENRFYGADTYDSGLWLCALKVFPEIARLMNEEFTARKYEELFKKASESFEKKLWDEEKGYYIKCTEKGSLDSNIQCRDDQLTGQWYTHFLYKGDLHPKERIKKALSSILKILKIEIPESGGKYIIRQEEYEDEKSVEGNWPGFSIAHFASEALYEGLVEEGLGAVEGIWELIFNRYKMAWDQPLALDPYRKPRGDRYMNSGSIWYLLWALQGFWINIREGRMRIFPNIPEEWKKQFVSPIVTGDFWGKLEWKERRKDLSVHISCSITIDKDFTLRSLALKGVRGYSLSHFQIEGYDIGSVEVRDNHWEYDEVVFDFKEDLDLLKGKPLIINYKLSKILT